MYIHGSMRLFKSRDRLFFGPRTGGNKIALEGPCHSRAGVGPPKRGSLLSVEGTLAYLMDLM